MTTITKLRRARGVSGVAKALLAGVALMLTASCHLEMYDQPKYTALAASEFYKDGASARPLVDNTVARGKTMTDELHTGKVGGVADSAYVSEFPIEVNELVIARGEARYNIYCITCHGEKGNGKGAVASLFKPKPPSFYDQTKFADYPLGKYYETIVYGRNAMYPYGYRIQDVNDRWAIIAYIKELQKNPPPAQ